MAGDRRRLGSSRFLDLPAEIRLAVYDAYFPHDCIKLCQDFVNPADIKYLVDFHEWEFCNIQDLRPLLRINRVIREEVLKHLFSNKDVLVDWQYCGGTGIRDAILPDGTATPICPTRRLGLAVENLITSVTISSLEAFWFSDETIRLYHGKDLHPDRAIQDDLVYLCDFMKRLTGLRRAVFVLVFAAATWTNHTFLTSNRCLAVFPPTVSVGFRLRVRVGLDSWSLPSRGGFYGGAQVVEWEKDVRPPALEAGLEKLAASMYRDSECE